MTVIVRQQTCQIEQGLRGKPDLKITADGQTWIKFIGKETNLVFALLQGKIRLKGTLPLLLKFAKCFPT